MPAEPDHPRITLLGPQRDPRLGQVIRNLGLSGKRFATITAGWRDREGDDGLLAEQLEHRTVNLRLWELMQRVWEADPELAEADRRRRLVLTEMQELYLVGLEQAVTGLDRIRSHTPRAEAVRDIAIEDAIALMRGMDERHIRRVKELHADFYATYRPEHREAVAQARFRVGQLIADCDAVVIPGGTSGCCSGRCTCSTWLPHWPCRVR